MAPVWGAAVGDGKPIVDNRTVSIPSLGPVPRTRPVVAVLCENATDRPPGLDGLDVDFRYCAADGLAEAVRGARALLLWDFFSTAVRDVWADADQLEWIHITAAGVDTLLFDELRESDVVVTNARGVFDRPLAEYVLGAVIAHAKDSRTQLRPAAPTRVAAPRDAQHHRRHRAGGRHRGHRAGDREAAARGRAGGPRRGPHGRHRRPRLRRGRRQRQPCGRGRLVRPPDPRRAADRRRPAAWSTPRCSTP